MRVGAVFSQADSGTDPDAIRQWAIDAEAAGFEHLMAYDHVLGASAERLGPGPFGSFPNAPYTVGAHLPRDPRAVQPPRRAHDDA